MSYTDIRPGQIAEKYDYFVAYPTLKPNQLQRLGQELVEKHGWVIFDSVKAQPHRGKSGLRRAYTGFASHKAAEAFLREKKFPLVETSTFYTLDGIGTHRRDIQCEDDEYQQRQRDMRSRKNLEQKLAQSAAMIAQKILGEGVFAMVRRARELRLGAAA